MKSMTGYGRARQSAHGREITVEVRAVNHRYLDCTIKAPRAYGFLEDALKKAAAARIARGRVDIFVSIEDVDAADCEIVAGGYIAALRRLRDQFGLADDISVLGVAKLPDVLSSRRAEVNADELTADVLQVFTEAADGFDVMRTREGQQMSIDVKGRAQTILSLVGQVETLGPERVTAYREKLYKRMQEVLESTQIDEQRILLEAAIFADKTAVDEETVRLRSHISQLELMLNEDGAVGRKLDFLVQEMNREANTIGSKANDVGLSRLVVDLKSEIEKIREQVQNIE